MIGQTEIHLKAKVLDSEYQTPSEHGVHMSESGRQIRPLNCYVIINALTCHRRETRFVADPADNAFPCKNKRGSFECSRLCCLFLTNAR